MGKWHMDFRIPTNLERYSFSESCYTGHDLSAYVRPGCMKVRIASSFCHGAKREMCILSRSDISLSVMDFISDASYIKPIGNPRYRYDSSFFKYGISPFWTTNWNSETLDGYFLEHVKQRVAHLSCRNERFNTSAAIDTSDRRSCSPSLVRLMITRSSAYAKMDIGWLWILKECWDFPRTMR